MEMPDENVNVVDWTFAIYPLSQIIYPSFCCKCNDDIHEHVSHLGIFCSLIVTRTEYPGLLFSVPVVSVKSPSARTSSGGGFIKIPYSAFTATSNRVSEFSEHLDKVGGEKWAGPFK
jgi:hypothetical protein